MSCWQGLFCPFKYVALLLQIALAVGKLMKLLTKVAKHVQRLTSPDILILTSPSISAHFVSTATQTALSFKHTDVNSAVSVM